jgi:hypothetical protein
MANGPGTAASDFAATQNLGYSRPQQPCSRAFISQVAHSTSIVQDDPAYYAQNNARLGLDPVLSCEIPETTHHTDDLSSHTFSSSLYQQPSITFPSSKLSTIEEILYQDGKSTYP